MKESLKKKLFAAAPELFKSVQDAPQWHVDVPDDLFPFLLELAGKIELFNTRYKKRRVRVLKIAITEANLEFVTQRSAPCVEKLIQSTRRDVRNYRKNLRTAILERAKHMGTTALFGAALLPDWKRQMPDETETLRKILEYAERFAVTPADWAQLARWYRQYLGDGEAAERCKFKKQ